MSPATEMNNIHLLWWLISSQIIIQLKLTSKNSINILQHEERKVAYGGVLSYIFAQTRLEGKTFILFHPSKHWRLEAFSFYQGKSSWRAADLDQGINLEWPNGDYKSYIMNP